MKYFTYWLRCLISSLLLSLRKWGAQTSRLNFLLELRSDCLALVQIRCIPFFYQSEFSFSPFCKKPLKQANLFSIFWRPSVQWRPKHAWKNASLKKIAWRPFSGSTVPAKILAKAHLSETKHENTKIFQLTWRELSMVHFAYLITRLINLNKDAIASGNAH